MGKSCRREESSLETDNGVANDGEKGKRSLAGGQCPRLLLGSPATDTLRELESPWHHSEGAEAAGVGSSMGVDRNGMGR